MGVTFIDLSGPIWFHLPWDLTLGQLLFDGGAWALLAPTLAAIVRPVPADQAA